MALRHPMLDEIRDIIRAGGGSEDPLLAARSAEWKASCPLACAVGAQAIEVGLPLEVREASCFQERIMRFFRDAEHAPGVREWACRRACHTVGAPVVPGEVDLLRRHRWAFAELPFAEFGGGCPGGLS